MKESLKRTSGEKRSQLFVSPRQLMQPQDIFRTAQLPNLYLRERKSVFIVFENDQFVDTTTDVP